jgi:GNAT superfamily N-acetyltransferase
VSLLSDYWLEREGRHTVEDERGFATFDIDEESKVCYIVDIYVAPKFRKEGVATQFANQIVDVAVSRGCTTLLGSVDPTCHGATESMKVLLAYGFELQSMGEKLIYFQKGL